MASKSEGDRRRLKLNYRTTEQIRNHAVAVLENRDIDDLDGGVDSIKGFHSLRQGPEATAEFFDTEQAEAQFVLETIKRWLEEVPAESICVAVRTNAQVADRYEQFCRLQALKPCASLVILRPRRKYQA